MSTPITSYCKDALFNLFSDADAGFNPLMLVTAPNYGVRPVKIDWQPTGSLSFFPIWTEPDALAESAELKYPLCFMYGMASWNTHESMGRTYAGPVQIGLDFWVDNEQTNVVKAGLQLENTCNAIEEVANLLLTDGNWPQLWGASNAVCLPPQFRRSQLHRGGREYRQQCQMVLKFTLDTN